MGNSPPQGVEGKWPRCVTLCPGALKYVVTSDLLGLAVVRLFYGFIGFAEAGFMFHHVPSCRLLVESV